ncbi:lipopolysaccharide assembly protein LapB [Synechococcus sp. PCC 7336]|uniref:tetratricopeptide repeat protein n=1 Tax=Synechococcus sp. PCC 7336 TaxID=195250 RepID=UPI0003479F43|nr:tetratricopeptide repeat protein [Synechococcus sp. PCC 7336]
MGKPSKRNWIFQAAIGIAVLAFVGFSLAPALGLLTRLNRNDLPATGLPVAKLERELAGYRIVLDREPENLTALQGLTDDLLQLGRIDEAIAPLQQWMALQPDRTGLALQLGQLQFQTGDRAAAVKTFQALYDRHPERSDILENLIGAQVASGDTDAAIAFLEQQLQKSGDRSETTELNLSLLLAKTYLNGDRRPAALALYDRLLADNPADFRPALEKAIALSSGPKDAIDLAAARQLFDLAESKAPSSTRKRIHQLAQQYRAKALTTATGLESAGGDTTAARSLGDNSKTTP